MFILLQFSPSASVKIPSFPWTPRQRSDTLLDQKERTSICCDRHVALECERGTGICIMAQLNSIRQHRCFIVFLWVIKGVTKVREAGTQGKQILPHKILACLNLLCPQSVCLLLHVTVSLSPTRK